MANLEHSLYNITVANTDLRTLIKGGELYVTLPTGDEVCLDGRGVSDAFAEQIIDYLTEQTRGAED